MPAIINRPQELVAVTPAATPGSIAPISESRPTAFAAVRRALKSVPALAALVIMSVVVLVALFAPVLGFSDPMALDPIQRLKPPSAEHWLGADAFGRDVASRIVYGARVSLVVGLGTAFASLAIGLLLGTLAGYFKLADALIMRIMDGVMAIPAILLAIALVSVSGATIMTVMIAIAIPEVPRVVRLVRSVILFVRTEPYVEAAISMGTPLPLLFLRHLIPSTVAPLIVQGTYIFAAAILTEAVLSFLGAGVPPEVPSWGNIMADGRMYFQLVSGLVLYPGIVLSLTVLSVNILGDAMRDALDPRTAGKI